MKITVKQLRYILATEKAGSITVAASNMAVSQPTLSGAISQVEKELGFDIFLRKGSGVALTDEGREFVLYARRVVEEMENLEYRYSKKAPNKIRFGVVTQRLAFAESAFVDTIKLLDENRYRFSFAHRGSYESVFNAVSSGQFDFGVFIVFNSDYRIVESNAKELNLDIVKLFSRQPQALMAKTHPFANRESLTFKELEAYPQISMGDEYDVPETMVQDNIIHVGSSMVLARFYRELNCYSIWCNLMPENLEANIVGVPIKTKKTMEIGYVTPSGVSLNDAKKLYIEQLMKFQNK